MNTLNFKNYAEGIILCVLASWWLITTLPKANQEFAAQIIFATKALKIHEEIIPSES